MRLVVAALVLTLAVAVTAAVFAIWPVVTDAPWEDSGPTSGRSPLQERRCTIAVELRLTAIEALAAPVRAPGFLDRQGTAGMTGEQLEEIWAQLDRAQSEIDRYC